MNAAAAQPPANRRIRVFVSSTFRDMVEDRNALMTHCWPELRRFCRERQVELVEVDLRWGIAEEQSTRKETLKLCLDEIKACRPFFIGLLGERYGWVPGDDAFTADLKEEQPWLKDLHGRSVTELEILHGVLNNPDMAGRAFFYFRDPAFKKGEADFASENAESTEKLRQLKERIRARFGVPPSGGSGVGVPPLGGLPAREEPARTGTPNEEGAEGKLPQPHLRENYANPDALAKYILEDLKAAIEAQFPKGSEPDPLTKEARDHEAFAEIRRRTYIGRPDYFEALDRHAAGDGGPLVLLGESGSGKSALLANWVERWRVAHPKDFIFQHYIGGTPDSADHGRLMRRLIEEIKRWADDPEDLPKSHVDMRRDFPVWLAKARIRAERQGVRFIIILDALNQLDEADHARLLGWLPAHPFNGPLRLIVSTLPGDTLKAVEDRGWTSLRIQPLTVDERRRMIADYLARFGKKLDAPRLERLAAATAAANPLYLKILLDELRVTGTHDRLDERLGEYLSAPDIPSLLRKVLERYQRDYEHDRPGLVGEALGLIWAARRGLTETELLQLLKPTDLAQLPLATWAPLRAALEEGLVDRGGILNFANDFLRAAVETTFLSDEAKRRARRLQLTGYFANISQPDDRKLDELPVLYRDLQQWGQLKELLADLPTFLRMRSSEEWSVELHQYWTQLIPYFDADTVYEYALRHLDPVAIASSNLPGLFSQLGNFHNERGEVKSAEAFYRKSIESVGTPERAWEMDRAATTNNLACLLVATGRSNEAEPLFRNALDINERIAPGQLNHAKALSNLGDLLVSIGKPREAEPLLRKALSIEEAQLGTNHPSVAKTLNGLALLQSSTQRPKEAEDLLRRALAIQEHCRGFGHPDVAVALHNLGAYLAATGRIAEAESLIQRSLEIVRGTFGAHSSQEAPFLESMRFVLDQAGRLQDTESCIRQQLAQKEREFGLRHPEVALVLLELARVRRDRGYAQDAHALLVQSISMIEEAARCDDATLALYLHNLATVLYEGNHFTVSDPLFQRVLAFIDHRDGETTDETSCELFTLAEVLRKAGQSGEAEPLYRRAIRMAEKNQKTEHPNFATMLHSLALALHSMRRNEEAELLFRSAIALFEKCGGGNHPHVAASLSGLGLLLLQSCRFSEAESLFLRALAIQQNAHGKHHPNVASVINNLGLICFAANRFQEAADLFERSLRILGPAVKRRECSDNQVRTTIGNYAKVLEHLGMADSQINTKLQAILA